MIEARIQAETLQEAVTACAHYGLPGPVFCNVCPAECGFAHVYFLTDECNGNLLQDAAERGLKIVDATIIPEPEDGKTLITLDGVILSLHEAD